MVTKQNRGRVEITETLLEQLPARPPKDLFVWDSECPGFGLKRTPSGTDVFVFGYSLNGRQRRMTLGTRTASVKVKQARAVARAASADVFMGIDPQDKKAQAQSEQLTVGALFAKYFEGASFRQNAERTKETDVSRYQSHIEPLLGKRMVNHLTRDDVLDLRDSIASGKTARTIKTDKARGVRKIKGGAGTAARSITLLSTVLSWANRQSLINTANVAMGVDVARTNRRRINISIATYKKLQETLDVMEADLSLSRAAADCIRIIMFTGARRNEIALMKWGWVASDFSQIVVPAESHKAGNKTKKSRIIVLSSKTAAILKQYTRGDDAELVFKPSRRIGESSHLMLSSAMQKVRKRAGLPDDFTLHALRHGIGSLMATEGQSLHQIAAVLGHASPRTAEIYVDFANTERDAAARLVASLLEQKIGATE